MFRGKHLRFNIRNSHGNKEQMEWLCAKKQIIQMAFKKTITLFSLVYVETASKVVFFS